MRTWFLTVMGVVALAGMAQADSAASLAKDGQELARLGRFREAIAMFKESDALEPRASNVCLIGLAYLRRDLWPQAELYFGQCRERTPSAEALPDWLVVAERQLDERLRTGAFAPVQIRVDSAGIPARVSISSFAADDEFGPRTIYLPVGRHVVTASAAGHTRVQTTVVVTARSPHQVVLRLENLQGRSRVPLALTAVGGSLIVAGVLYHALALTPVRDSLVMASDPNNPDPMRYDLISDKFDRRRLVTLGLYGAGAAAVLTGLVLRYSFGKPTESSVQVSARMREGGAIVGLEWRR